MRFLKAEEAKKAKWFSRRHETQESHDAAVKAHPYTGGRKNRLRRVEGRRNG